MNTQESLPENRHQQSENFDSPMSLSAQAGLPAGLWQEIRDTGGNTRPFDSMSVLRENSRLNHRIT